MIDFVIAGQPKSGTTALAQFLAEHPGLCICMPKEPSYFATDLMTESDGFHGTPRHFEFRTPEQYEALFSGCSGVALRGDASTGYLYSREAAANIHAANPAAKIIVMLREPVAFMHSLHMQYLNETTEDELDFANALAKEPARRRGEHVPKRARVPSYLLYRERARYCEQLERYTHLFPGDQLLVLVTEEFARDNAGHYRRVLEFLGVEPSFTPSFGAVHPSTTARSRRLNRALNTPALKRLAFASLGPHRYDAVRMRVTRMVMRRQQRAPLPPGLTRDLREEFASEVDAISRAVDRDLRGVWGY